jgi:hypothetical protein
MIARTRASEGAPGRCVNPAERGEFLRDRARRTGPSRPGDGEFAPLPHSLQPAKTFPDADFVLMERATDREQPFGCGPSRLRSRRNDGSGPSRLEPDGVNLWN